MFHPALPLMLLWLAAWSLPAAAQTNEVNVLAPDSSAAVAGVPAEGGSVATGPDTLFGFCATRAATMPERVRNACHELLYEAVAAQTAALKRRGQAGGSDGEGFVGEHTRLTLEDQRRHGEMLFWLVLLVVVVGVAAGVAQFIRSFRSAGEAGSAEIAISNNELTFKTTWLGALLLGLSMGFLFLYLVFIYPVRFVAT